MIHRTEQEWHCLHVAQRGIDPTHRDRLRTIINVHELKGYMLQLHRDGRLDDSARADIAHRLAELELLYGRKLG